MEQGLWYFSLDSWVLGRFIRSWTLTPLMWTSVSMILLTLISGTTLQQLSWSKERWSQECVCSLVTSLCIVRWQLQNIGKMVLHTLECTEPSEGTLERSRCMTGWKRGSTLKSCIGWIINVGDSIGHKTRVRCVMWIIISHAILSVKSTTNGIMIVRNVILDAGVALVIPNSVASHVI